MSRADPRALLAACRLPAFAAPMFLVSGPALVIAAARAGIVGSFPTQNCRTAAELDGWLAEIAAAVPAGTPWAVNLITHSSNDRLAQDLAAVVRHRPPIVITAMGSPRPALAAVHGYGGVVIADVATAAMARKAAEAGADGLACIAAGAGGHTGQLSPFAFLASVRAFFGGLVVLGGGITDGAGIAGAIAAGADAVYLGTRFLAAAESMAAPAYKAMVVAHGQADLVVSAAVSGTPASWLRPSLAACGFDPDGGAPAARDYRPGEAARKWRDVWSAGQGIDAVTAVEPASVIVDRLAAEYAAARARFATAASPCRG